MLLCLYQYLSTVTIYGLGNKIKIVRLVLVWGHFKFIFKAYKMQQCTLKLLEILLERNQFYKFILRGGSMLTDSPLRPTKISDPCYITAYYVSICEQNFIPLRDRLIPIMHCLLMVKGGLSPIKASLSKVFNFFKYYFEMSGEKTYR